MPPRIFEPSRDFVDQSYLTRFRGYINRRHEVDLPTYETLHAFSVQRPNDFWVALWSFLTELGLLKASVQPTCGVDESVPIDRLPKFYEGAKLNYAEQILSRTGREIAVQCINEENLWMPQQVTRDQLREAVRLFQDALNATGFSRGDVMVIVGGSTLNSLALVLAVASIAGVVACFATDAGERVLLERVGQLNPRMLFAEPTYRYNGRQHDIASRIEGVWDSVDRQAEAKLVSMGKTTPPGWMSLDAFCANATGKPLTFAQVPFHEPFVVLFSSGTTGTPKGIVHSQGGLIINGMKEHLLHYNHDSRAVHYHYAGIGWTLWNIMIGALMTGTRIVLYDGSPFYPSPEEQLKGVLATGVTSFGAGPRYFTELQKAGVDARPYVEKVDKIPSAGALLTEETSLWIKESFGSDICQISTSGGTELCGNFVTGTQCLPVYAGENQVKCLGMDVDVFLPDGSSASPGESGELVCKKPFPNMPVYFLNDPDGKRYHAAYFEGIDPHVWTHGDFIRFNPDTGGSVIMGRSDGVLNPSGIRFGSGEIYTALERCAKHEVIDSICVAQQRHQDPAERVYLFLQMKDGKQFTQRLRRQIQDSISNDLSRRHVPHFMFDATDIGIPYNVNGKKLEIPLRAVLSEGKKAFGRRKFTQAEVQALEKYLPYFEVEKMFGEDNGMSKSKL